MMNINNMQIFNIFKISDNSIYIYRIEINFLYELGLHNIFIYYTTKMRAIKYAFGTNPGSFGRDVFIVAAKRTPIGAFMSKLSHL